MNLKKLTKYKISTESAKVAYDYFLWKCWIKYTYNTFRTYLNTLTVKEIISLSHKKRCFMWWGRQSEFQKHLKWYHRYNHWDKIKRLSEEYWLHIQTIYWWIKKVKKSFGDL